MTRTPLLLACLLAAACSSSPIGTASNARVVKVVAAENFYGSLVSQIGGSHVQVTNVIDSPDADPHDYEPVPADGRAVADAGLLVYDGIGYDTWAGKLADASPSSSRKIIDVGKLVGEPDDGNPHQWYDPQSVREVIDEVAADLADLDPDDARAFTYGARSLESAGLKDYHDTIARIRDHYAGTKVGASESIFAELAPALGLDLITPSGFLKDISEGTDPSAADKRTIDRQIASKQIAVYVYNSQNATPDIQAQLAAAHAQGIPTATITETMTPAGASFQQWQVAQLRDIEAALAQATGT